MAQVSPARKIAFEILLQVDAGQAFASDLLQGRQVSALSERDRGLATEIVMGVLRWRGEIDHRLQELSGRSAQSLDREILTALRMGVYQIAFLEKIPKSAAVNESVELTKLSRKRSAAGLVNAVLRKCEPERLLEHLGGAVPDAPALLAGVRRSVPAWMLERWEKNFGAEAANRLAWAATQVPPTTLRICSTTPGPEEVIRKLEEKGSNVRRGKYASSALIAEEGETVVSRLADEMGLAIQDEASQLVPELLRVRPGERVLDLCAAPGMKTSLLADAVGDGLLVACDASARRLETLQRLLPRLTANASAVRLVRLDATQPLPFRQQFDRILVDAPCSGTGTLGPQSGNQMAAYEGRSRAAAGDSAEDSFERAIGARAGRPAGLRNVLAGAGRERTGCGKRAGRDRRLPAARPRRACDRIAEDRAADRCARLLPHAA